MASLKESYRDIHNPAVPSALNAALQGAFKTRALLIVMTAFGANCHCGFHKML